MTDLYHNLIHVLILLDRLCAAATVTFRSVSRRDKQSLAPERLNANIRKRHKPLDI